MRWPGRWLTRFHSAGPAGAMFLLGKCFQTELQMLSRAFQRHRSLKVSFHVQELPGEINGDLGPSHLLTSADNGRGTNLITRRPCTTFTRDFVVIVVLLRCCGGFLYARQVFLKRNFFPNESDAPHIVSVALVKILFRGASAVASLLHKVCSPFESSR